jgi:hypothetical protein
LTFDQLNPARADCRLRVSLKNSGREHRPGELGLERGAEIGGRYGAAARADNEHRQPGMALLHLGGDRAHIGGVRRAGAEAVAHSLPCLLVARIVEDHRQDAVADELAPRARQEISLLEADLPLLAPQVDVSAAAGEKQRHRFGLAAAHVRDEEGKRDAGTRLQRDDLLRLGGQSGRDGR